MKAWPLGLGVGVLLALGLLVWQSSGGRPTSPRVTASNGLTGMPVQRRPRASGTEAATPAPPSPFSAGSRAATASAFPWLSARQLDDGRRFMKVDIAALNALEVGSGLEVEVAEPGVLWPALVEGEQRIEDVRRLTGSWWDASGREHAFSLSLSSDGRYVAGSFDAGDGQRVFEALEGAGWMQVAGTAMAEPGGEADALQSP